MRMGLFNRFKKILIIEDDVHLRHAVVDKLKSMGYRVMEAEDGNSGLSMAIKERPDLILLDLMLPKMDGLSLLSELRRDDWGKDVPVIVITILNATDERRAKAKELNVVEYIDKSKYQLDEIIQKIKKAL